MRALAPSMLSAALIAALGTCAFWWATDGLRVYTSEAARRLAVREQPRPAPDILLEDAQGKRFRFSDLRGHPVVVDFIYTRCPTVCVAAGGALERLTRRLDAAAGTGKGDALLLSISFDPRDTRARLADYAHRFHAEHARWRIARPLRHEDLQILLRRFGVVVIADGMGGFQHNAALHLLDRRGRLARIVDLGEPGPTLDALKEL